MLRKSSKNKKPFYLLTVLFTVGLFFWAFQQVNHVELPKPNEPALFYATQCKDDLRLVYEKAILEAKESIDITVFSFYDYHLFRLLKQKSQEGVLVTVIIDKKNGNYLRKYLGPHALIVKRKPVGLMHRKLMVIDSHLVLAGSTNLTSESLWLHDNLLMGWDDRNLASLIKQKNMMQIIQTATPQKNVSLEKNEFNLGDQKVEVWFLPEDKLALARLIQLIESAKKTIKIAMFTWSHQELAQAVCEAKKRGVQVEVAIDARSSEGASSKVVQILQLAGIRVGRNRGSQLLHHKFAHIDNILVCGSTNWTKAAFRANEDDFFVIHDLTESQDQFMQRLWKIIAAESQLSH